MRIRPHLTRAAVAALTGLALAGTGTASGQAVPEPGIVLYGKVWSNGQVLVSGQLALTYAAGATTVRVTVPLRQLKTADGDTHSYRVMFPAASATTGAAVGAGVLPVTDSPVTYTRSATLDGQPLRLEASRTQDTFSIATRGKIERLDLVAQGSAIPTYSISGSVNYAGRQPGPVVVQLYENAAFQGTPVRNVTIAAVTRGVEFTTSGLPGAAYYVRAFKDFDGNGAPGAAEAYGVCAANPVVVPPDAPGLSVTLADVDRDGDGLPDWWELQYLGGLDFGPNDDVDADGKTNAAEYLAQEPPSGILLDLYPGWNLVSIPVEPADASVAVVFAPARVSKQVYGWDGQSYLEAATVAPLHGYWVYVAGSAGDLPVVCEVSGTPVLDSTRALPSGWSLIGPVTNGPVPVDARISGIWRWDAVNGVYCPPENGLEIGTGYWVFVLAEDGRAAEAQTGQDRPRR